MKVNRIVANIKSKNIDLARSFYQDILGLDLLMDHGWIQTYGSDVSMRIQVSVASEGGSGTDVPALSIEVDDLDEVLRRLRSKNIPVIYGPVDESWGVRRVYVHDPMGTLVNILQHI